MKKRKRRNGLTLIELMVTIAAASILMLTVGLILIMAFRSWRMNNAYVDLRRDSAYAFSMMTRDVRKADYDTLTDGTTLTLPSATYTRSGNTLTHNGGVLIPKNVQFFNSEKKPSGDGVLLTLELANAEFGIAMTNQVFINTRN